MTRRFFINQFSDLYEERQNSLKLARQMNLELAPDLIERYNQRPKSVSHWALKLKQADSTFCYESLEFNVTVVRDTDLFPSKGKMPVLPRPQQ